MASSTVVKVGAGRSGLMDRRQNDAVARRTDGRFGNSGDINHGLTEDELRALIADDLRMFMRRPMAGDGDGNHLRPRPFLLDRLVRVAT